MRKTGYFSLMWYHIPQTLRKFTTKFFFPDCPILDIMYSKIYRGPTLPHNWNWHPPAKLVRGVFRASGRSVQSPFLPGRPSFILPPRPPSPYQTVLHRNAPYSFRPQNRHLPGRTVIERDKMATIHLWLPSEPWQNAAERDKTWKDREMPGNTYASSQATDRL